MTQAVLIAALLAAAAGLAQAAASDVPALEQLRASGCGGQRPPAATPLVHVDALDAAAREVARGRPALEALRDHGIAATRVFHAQLSGYNSAQAVAEAMRQSHCDALMTPAFTSFGVHREGRSWSLLLAATLQDPGPAGTVAARVLQLTNEARARPRRCGGRQFPAAAALRLDAALGRAALSHARDMAAHSFLEHRGSDGSGPSERAERAGYEWRSVGENVASGQATAEQVVAEWLESPPHCANIMEARFTDMGLAFALQPRSAGAIYWAQEFGTRHGK
jgi:uncharacterized protein YkwD